ncbi:MAG: RDD family protein [Bacteroidetes bacterium]|nr:RDD family protein [Bacteroidota bacterium]
MSQIAITTSQNVNIFFSTASVGERILAFIIDILVKVLYLIFVYLAVFHYFNLYAYFESLDRFSAIALFLMFTFPIYIDTLLWEIFSGGQTLGKKIMKIRVVKIDGYQAHISDYFLRWVMRLVDIYTNSGMVGICAMILSKNGQRLGDIATGTTVISLKNKVNISHTILENINEDYVPIFPQVIAFSDNDMRIIKDQFLKASQQKDQKIIEKLVTKIQSVLGMNGDLKGLSKKQFIETIIKDYNFYTGKEVA